MDIRCAACRQPLTGSPGEAIFLVYDQGRSEGIREVVYSCRNVDCYTAVKGALAQKGTYSRKQSFSDISNPLLFVSWFEWLLAASQKTNKTHGFDDDAYTQVRIATRAAAARILRVPTQDEQRQAVQARSRGAPLGLKATHNDLPTLHNPAVLADWVERCLDEARARKGRISKLAWSRVIRVMQRASKKAFREPTEQQASRAAVLRGSPRGLGALTPLD